MSDLRLEQIQRLVISGHGRLPHAAYLLVSLSDRASSRRWLAAVAERVTFADEQATDRAVHVALSRHAIGVLSLEDELVRGLSLEFFGGMALPWRSRILGDTGASDPQHWTWGGPTTTPVGAVLMLYAAEAQVLERIVADEEAAVQHAGCSVLRHLATVALPGWREHFGFRDGVSEPFLAGHHQGSEDELIAPGEFILGYPNEYGEWPQSPHVDHGESLPPHPIERAAGDLGANGCYVVFRQLQQHVATFWDYARSSARPGRDVTSEAVEIASKMVGRWPSGVSLATSSQDEGPVRNDFDYSEDPAGHGCPIGAHVRRMHPRGAVRPDRWSAASRRAARRHRLLRRGRSYGPPLAASVDVEDLLEQPDDGVERGLHFVCLVANIRRQFEFVQQNWMQNPTFNGLVADPDPISGQATTGERDFTIQANPVRRRLRHVPSFVTVRGGAYLFLPSRAALRWLSTPR